MKKNVASQVIGAQMVSATDGSAFTGTVTCYVTGDGGTQAAGSVGSGACAHEGNGFHSYSPAQAETNYDHIAFTFIGTGAVPVTIQVYTAFPQTGDGYGRLGAPAGASIAADIAALPTDADVNAACDSALADYDAPTKTEMDNAFATTNGYLDTEVAAILAAVDTEVAAIKAKTDNLPASPAATGDILSAAAVADAVWDEVISEHLAAGSTGAAVNAAGSAGDPWTTPLPGAYGAGTAGKIIGDNVNAPIATVDAVVDAIKAKTDGLNFTGTDVKATLDGEEVTPSAASKTGYALTAAYDAAKTTATQTSVDGVDDKIDAIAAYVDTEVAAILAAVDTEISDILSAIAKVPKSDGEVAFNPTALASIKTAIEAAGSHLATIKAKTDGLNFTGVDVKATLDGEEVTPTTASKTGYALTSAYDAAKAAAAAGAQMDLVNAPNATALAAAANALLDLANAVETGVTPRGALRIATAVGAGQLSGAGSAEEVLKNPAGSKNRVTAEVDASGNRTSISLDLA